MVKASPALAKQIGINLTLMQLTHHKTLSTAAPISSGDSRAAKAKQGLNAGGIIIDEAHVVTARFVSESSIDKAGASRDEPLHIEVSTAGKDPDEYGKKQYDYGKQVESGEVEDQGFFFLAYEAPAELTDEELDADPVKYGRMANPTWGRIIQEDEYLADYNRSKRSLADLADFKTFRLNIWQHTLSPWIRIEDWNKCRVDFDESELEGRQCCAGLDLGITRDMSALVFVFPWGNGAFRVLPYCYAPEKSVQLLATKVPKVLEWVRQKKLIVTRGNTTDYSQILRDFEAKAKQFYVSRLVYDPRFAEQLTQDMSERTGVERNSFGQGPGKYNEPTQNFERAVLEGLIEHDGNPVMAWEMGHVNVATDRHGNMMPVKPERADHKKIDIIVAAVMGFAAARLETDAGYGVGEGKWTLRD